MSDLIWRKAVDSDWEKVASLLTAADLPLDGAQDQLSHFWLVFDQDALIACAGIEPYGEAGLLRSVAVDESFRGRGMGQQLINHVLREAQAEGIRQIALLTTTAADYFPRWGFRVVKRQDLPLSVQQSVEFQDACPGSAVAMLLETV